MMDTSMNTVNGAGKRTAGNSMKKVLIFGVGGFVGEYLAREFMSNGYTVYGSDIRKTTSIPENVIFESADLLDAEEVKALILKIHPTHIINLAAISNVGLSWNIPQKTIAVNVNGALNILESARQCEEMPRVLLIGSSEEYVVTDKPINEECELNANNPYGISKMMQEKFSEIYRERYRMKIFHVRPFNHTGIGQADSFVLPSFCKQVAEIEKSGQPGTMYVGNLSAKRDFVNVKDVARAYRMIIESDSYDKIFNVGTGKAYSIREMLNYIISLSSWEIKVEMDLARFRPADNPFICCDYSNIKKTLGWEPEFSIFETIREMYEFYLKK